MSDASEHSTPGGADEGRGVRALLKPRGIVLVGVSDDPKKMTGGPFRALQRSPFPGPVYAVSRTRDTLGEFPVRRSVAEVGDDADVALIVVPRDAVAEALEECGRKGIAAAVVITSGFADIGGEGVVQQKRLAEIAARTGIRVVGPNCTGYFSAEVTSTSAPRRPSSAAATGRARSA